MQSQATQGGIHENFTIIKESGFEYIETNPSNPHVLLLLHGLFGAMSNFNWILSEFGDRMNVVIPLLPIFRLPTKKVSVEGLTNHICEFVTFKNFGVVNILGNSVGGHVGLLFAISNPAVVQTLTLTGSSGLYESAFGSTFPRRGDYDYIREISIKVFYDTTLATKEMIDNVYHIVNDPVRAIKVLYIARSALRTNLSSQVHKIDCPVLLIWGRNDTITPPFVAEKFTQLIEDAELHWIDRCGHAAMMEHPQRFNQILDHFFSQHLFNPNYALELRSEG